MDFKNSDWKPDPVYIRFMIWKHIFQQNNKLRQKAKTTIASKQERQCPAVAKLRFRLNWLKQTWQDLKIVHHLWSISLTKF